MLGIMFFSVQEVKAANYDTSVSFYDMDIVLSDYLGTKFGSYKSSYVGSYNVYDSSLQSYQVKDVYLWADNVIAGMSSTYVSEWIGSLSFYVDAPFEAYGTKYPDMYRPTEELWSSAHVLTAFTPSGNGSPMLGVNYFPSSTGMSYSTVSDVKLSALKIVSSGVTLPVGTSIGVLKMKVTIDFSSFLHEGSYFVPFSYLVNSTSGTFPQVLYNKENYSVFYGLTSQEYATSQITAFNLSSNILNSSLCMNVNMSYHSFSFDIYMFVNQSISSFSYTVNFNNINVYVADSNVILDTLQQGNADANKNAQDIMHSYDSSNQQDDNQRFEDSRKELQEEEDNLFGSAMEGFDDLNLDDYSFKKFAAMQSALSFVSGFLQSLYVQMGDFGSIVTIGLVLLIASLVIGIYKYQVIDHSG